MSRILPILFNTGMVQAILDGRKTETRRVMKPQPLFYTGRKYIFDDKEVPKQWEDCSDIIGTYQYQPGDILYVRETWCRGSLDYQEEKYYYRADGNNFHCHWHPSIHMPRAAARIWLKVGDVRIERLQDITEKQAQMEGAVRCYEEKRPDEDGPVIYQSEDGGGYHTLGFKAVWDSTIKKPDRSKFGWDANPWVWVIEFRRCGKPEGGE